MKAALRRQIRAARAGRVAADDFTDRVLARIPSTARVCCYVALPGEPPTAELIAALLARGQEVYLPVAGDGLEWVAAADSAPWRAWGVPGVGPCAAPQVSLPEPDVIVVPALAVDRDGRRLGQGGGYYDRFVPRHPRARIIALLWSGEVLPDVAAEPHDIRVDEWVLADG